MTDSGWLVAKRFDTEIEALRYAVANRSEDFDIIDASAKKRERKEEEDLEEPPLKKSKRLSPPGVSLFAASFKKIHCIMNAEGVVDFSVYYKRKADSRHQINTLATCMELVDPATPLTIYTSFTYVVKSIVMFDVWERNWNSSRITNSKAWRKFYNLYKQREVPPVFKIMQREGQRQTYPNPLFDKVYKIAKACQRQTKIDKFIET